MTSTIIEVRPASSDPAQRKNERSLRPPKPPRRMPKAPVQRAPLSRAQFLVRSSLLVLAAMLIAFVLNVAVFSHIQHLVAQQQLSNEFTEQLAAGTAPVSEGTFEKTLLSDGAPLGILTIPRLGVKEVFVEGTSSDTIKSGPGHRRDTVLPGQAGTSVLFGRAAAFGGPFGRIQELAPGDTFTVRTGQGLTRFSVIGVRYAGDPAPAAPTVTQSRVILQTARGASFVPTGIAYVDAQAVTPAKPAGTRQTTQISLPAEQLPLASDGSTVWALVFALQALIVVELAAVWAYRRIGAQKTWIVFLPLTVLTVLYVTNQLTILLPNLL